MYMYMHIVPPSFFPPSLSHLQKASISSSECSIDHVTTTWISVIKESLHVLLYLSNTS